MGTLGWITIGMVVVFVIAWIGLGEKPRDSTIRDYQKDGGKLHREKPPAAPKSDEEA